jgi:hypothetical protein
VIHNPRPLPSAEGDYSFPPVYEVLALLRDLAFTIEYYNINRLPGGKQLHSEVRYFQAHARRMLQNLAPQHRAKVDRLAQWEALDNGEGEEGPEPVQQTPVDGGLVLDGRRYHLPGYREQPPATDKQTAKQAAPPERCPGAVYNGKGQPRLPCHLAIRHDGPCKFVPSFNDCL